MQFCAPTFLQLPGDDSYVYENDTISCLWLDFNLKIKYCNQREEKGQCFYVQHCIAVCFISNNSVLCMLLTNTIFSIASDKISKHLKLSVES